MAKSLAGWQGYPNVCYVCGERIYLSGPRATGAVFGIKTSRHPECRPAFICRDPEGDWIRDQEERWGALPLGEPETSEAPRSLDDIRRAS